MADLEPDCSSAGNTTSTTSSTAKAYISSNATIYPVCNNNGSGCPPSTTKSDPHTVIQTIYPACNQNGLGCSPPTTKLDTHAPIHTLPGGSPPANGKSTSAADGLHQPSNSVADKKPGSPTQTVVTFTGTAAGLRPVSFLLAGGFLILGFYF